MKYHNRTLLKSLLNDSSFKSWVDKSNKNDVLFWNTWISDNPHEIETIETAKAIITGVSFEKIAIDDLKVAAALENVLQKIDGSKTIQIHPQANKKSKKHLIYAAAAIVLVLFGLFAITNQSTAVIHKTGYGEIINLKLLDGTTVTLNGNSEISYDKKNSRDITLKGEAYFKVKPILSTNAKFWVHTEDLRVEVYGTQFHVNTREEKTNVLLDEGSIHLLLKNGDVRKMAPGELVSFSKEKNDIVHQKVNNDLKYSLWREGTYIFNNTNLKEVMKYVSYTYGLSSEFLDKELEQKIITGGIPNQNLKICLSAIEKSTGTRIVVRDNKLLILKTKTNLTQNIMKRNQLIKAFFICVLFLGVGNARANGPTEAKVSLSDFLSEISEKHEVFFTYDSKLVSNTILDPAEYDYAKLNSIITKLERKTKFDFEYLGNKYYVVYSKKEEKGKLNRLPFF